MWRNVVFIIISITVLFSCDKEKDYAHPYSFYYWKTTLALNPTEQKVLDESSGTDLYVRLFDVDKINGKFEPIATAVKKEGFKTKKNIVPVIFITNRTFLNIQPKEIEFLANSVHRLIQEKYETFGFFNLKEIQIDCDWTNGTQHDYFKFLELLKKASGKEITSTLRLHQVKDKEKTGVPPVDKVYLMCYSTSSPLENSNKNSILDVGTLKSYLMNIEDYPIQDITVALPIYSWGIIENHIGRHKLINGLNASDLENPNFKKINENEAQVLQDGFYFGFFLNQGFKIKIEEISTEDLKETVSFLEKKIQSFPIVYYQLDHKFIENKDFKL